MFPKYSDDPEKDDSLNFECVCYMIILTSQTSSFCRNVKNKKKVEKSNTGEWQKRIFFR